MKGQRRRLSTAAGLALSLLVAGCASQAAPTPIVFEGKLPADPGPDQGGAALQQQVFADGEVTFDEYERAVTAGIECMRDEGFDVEGPMRYPDGYLVISPGFDPHLQLTLRARGTDAGDGVDRFGPVNERCQAQWYYAIEQIWIEQNEPTQAEINAWLERAWDCAREKGLPLSNPPTEAEAMESTAYGCEPWVSDG